MTVSEYQTGSEAFAALLARYERVTILSHIQPDADAIGTALGVYHWLKEQGKRVEVVNASSPMPLHLDFLPGYAKVKQHIDHDDGLVITCDCGSYDRLGFDLEGRTIVNIDHHITNTRFGTLNLVDTDAVASAQIAYGILKELHPISSQSAVAFYAALVSDTRNFTTGNMHAGIFALAQELVTCGVNVPDVTRHMLHRRSLSSLRILGRAIDSLELLRNGQVAVMSLSRDEQMRWGAENSDMDGVVDYARSLVTVRLAILLVEHEDHMKVSLRSKGIDVSRIARHFGGGGHREAAGYETPGMISFEAVRSQLLEEIDRSGVL